MTNDTKTGKRTESEGDSTIVEYIRKAKRAQSRRREAPRMNVGTRTEIAQKDLVRMYAPECLPRIVNGKPVPPEYHEFWANESDLKNLANDGYAPKLDDYGDIVRTPGGTVLTTIPWDLHEANLAAPIARAKHRLGEAPSEAAGENPGVVSEEIGRAE